MAALRDLRLLGVAAVAQQRDDHFARSEIRVALANLGNNAADFAVGQIENGGFVWYLPPISRVSWKAMPAARTAIPYAPQPQRQLG